MKNLFTILTISLICSLGLRSQTIVYQEGFEGATPSITTSGTQPWSVNTTLFHSGIKSYSAHIINPGDSSVMTTTSFSTVGNTYVLLEFSHICKIEFFDAGEIFVSSNNGASWTKLTETQYLGSGGFSAATGDKFTSTAYTSWLPGNPSIPTNGWWQTEIFDISALASNASQVLVRFILRDINNTTQFENWGWVVDDIKVTVAISELIPPVITHLPPMLADTVYSAGPFWVYTSIVDPSGIDTAYIVYTVNAGTPDTVGMTNTSGNLFSGSIPTQSFFSTICYKVVAVDGSISHNTAYLPSSGCNSLFNKQAMMGIYTIGGTGADYATITAAVTALTTSGVSGPVEFLIAPGTYTGQITLTAVTGMDAVNTVTFRSANNDSTSVIIQFNATSSAANWVVRLNGASHFIFRHLTIQAQSTTYGRVVELINGSTYNLFAYNRLISAGSSTSTTACIYDYNTLNNYNTYLNNYMQGGYYTIYIYGVSTTSWQKGTVIQGNEIVGSYYYPMYIYYSDSVQIIGNYIHSGVAPYSYGISCYYPNNGYRIVGNIVKIQTTSTSACYGMRDYYGNYYSYNASPTGYGLVANNMVSIVGGTGTHYGLYSYYCNGSENYFNSIHIAGGSTSSRALYQYNTASNTLGQTYKNNIFSVTVGGGFAAYFGTVAQVMACDYNNYHTNGSYLAYWGGNQANLAALKTASGKNQNSVSINPPFMAPDNLRLSNTLLSALGVYIPLVTMDIFGTPRSPLPTIGAYEIPLIPKDAGVINIVTPTSQSVISEGATVPVTVTVQNFGTDTINSVDVYYSVNGGTPVLVTYTGQLLSFQTTQLVMPSYISPAGQTSLCAYTALAGDTNIFNDKSCVNYHATPITDAFLTKVLPIQGGCGLGFDTVKVVVKNIGVTAISSGFSVSYKVQGSSIPVTQTVGSSIPVSDSLTITFTTPVNLFTTVDSVFKIIAWVDVTGDNVKYNDTASYNVISYAIPPSPVVVTPITIGYNTSSILSATSSSTVLWYTTPTSVTPVGVGPTYQTPFLYDTTVYYPAALSSVNCQSPRVPLTVFVTGHPPVDAGIVTIVNPIGSALSGVPEPVQVELKNFGLSTLQSAQIVWSLNNIVQDTLQWTGNLSYNTTTTVTLDSVVLLTGTHCIKAWTRMPNLIADTVNSNDTAGVCFPACMKGIYTIGPATTGTYDFNTFNAALTALHSIKPCGHVVFDVYPGTYTEQITTLHVLGTDANTTITFRGVTGDSTSVILQYAATSSTDNWVVKFNGGSYFTFKHMTIRATGASNGKVFEFIAAASNNTISNCRLETSITSTSSTFACIYSQNMGHGSNNLTINNSVLKGGYYGIYWYGSTGVSLKKKFNVVNNIFEDYYYYGIYTYYTDSVIIRGNTMKNRANSGGLYPLYVGYTTGYGEVCKNNITSTGTSSHYGIYISYKQAASSDPLLVANNMLTQSGNLTGTVYGMYVVGSNFVNVFYNTIRIAGGSATAGRAFVQSSGAFVKIINNIFSNHNGGFAYYVSTPGGISMSDHNNYYTTGAVLAYWVANQNTLALLQSANNQDQNSLNINPPYVSATDLHLATTALSAKAAQVSEVTDDIDGDPRTPMPTMGADEIPLISDDAGVLAILSPGTQTNEGQLYPVLVTVANFGTNTITSLTVQYSVNGGTPVSVPYTGNLPSMGNVNITMPDIASPAGSSVICARTILPGDTNTFNDELCKNFFGTPVFDAEVMKVLGPDGACGMGLDTIGVWVRNLGVNAINSPSPSTVSIRYRLKPSLPVVIQSFTPVLLPNDSLLVYFNTLADFSVTTATDTFKVQAWIDLQGDNVKYNDTASMEVISMHTPAAPAISDTTIPYGSFVTLHAISPDSISWYATDTSSVELAKGPYFTTPILLDTTVYWLQASTGAIQLSGPYNPGSNIAPLATASASNCSTGPCSTLNDLSLGTCGTQQMWISTSSPPSLVPHTDWIDFVWPAEVSIDGMKIHHAQNNARFLTGATLYKWDAGNWVSFYTFSNLTMQCENVVPFPLVTTTKLRITSFQMTGTGQTSNPNFREIEIFEGASIGCSSLRVPVTVNVMGIPPYDLGINELNVNEGCAIYNEPVTIKIYNQGIDTMFGGATATYRINNNPWIPLETITATIAPNDSIYYTFNTLANLTAPAMNDTMFTITAKVTHTLDPNLQNDTIVKDSIISKKTPVTPTVTTPVNIPYGTQAVLNASSPTNDTITWYLSDTASIAVGGGTPFTTPVLYTNTTYWVQAGTSFFIDSSLFVGTQSSNYQAAQTRGYHFTAPVDMTITELMVPTTVTQGPQYIQVVKFAGYPVVYPNASQHTTLAYIANAPYGVPQSVNIPVQAGDEIGIIGATNSSGTTMSNSYGQSLVPSSINGIPVTLTRLVYQSPLVSGQAPTGTISMEVSANIARVEMKYQIGIPGCASTRAPVNVVVANPQPCDMGITTILYPVTAVNLGSQENVTVKVRNYGTAAQSNIPVSFKIDNLPVVTETITSTIPSNDSLTFTFNAKANLSIAGNTYQIKAWTGLSCDNTHQNDTAWKPVTNLLPNYCNSTATSALYQEITTVSIGTVFSHTSPAVGAMYTNHSTTVAPPMLSPGITYPMSITSSFAPGASTTYNCWVKAWIDFNRDGIFNPSTEEIFSQATTSSNTVTANIQVPFNALNGNTLMRVVLNQTTVAGNVNPCNTYSYGETEDYMITIAPQSQCDAGVIQIITPPSLSQAGTPLPVWVKFMNFGSNPIAPGTLSIAYTLNSGTPVVVAYPSGLSSGGVDSIQMPDVTLPMGNNTLCAYTILACDTTQFNNEVCKGTYGQFYTTLPFFDDFESANMWYKPATAQNWQYGTPSANIINSAYSGTKSWVTNLTGDYTNNADEYLYTPVFSFMGLGGFDTISLSFWHWCAMASGDYGRVQYSTNGGQSWINLGAVGDLNGTNWYNVFSGGQNYFSHTNSGWMYSSYKLDPNYFNAKPEVQFRFQFYSNTSATSNGWALDNFRLSLPVVPNDVGVTAILVPLNDTAAGIPVNVKIIITNFGTNTQNMIPVELRLNGNLVSAETWTGTVANNGTAQYTFVLPFTVPASSYALCARTQLPNDAFPMNDEICKNLNSLPAYHDVGIAQILSPLPDSVGRICFYEAATHSWYEFPVAVSLKNHGQNTQTSVPIKYTFLNGGPVNIQTWTGTLAYGDSVVVLLNNLFRPNLGVQQLCVETDLIGDFVTTNNKACRTYTGVTCIGVDDMGGELFALMQNVPNPAKGTTVIGYTVPQGGRVTFGLANMVSQIMQTESYTVEAGSHQIELDVTTLAAGVYYYFVEYNGERLTRKMVVSK